MQYDKNQIYFTTEHKNNLIKIYTNNDVVPTVMPKIKKEYIYAAGIAIVIIILMNNK